MFGLPEYAVFGGVAALAFASAQIFIKLVSKYNIDNRDSMLFYFMLASGLSTPFIYPLTSQTLPSFMTMQLLLLISITLLIGFFMFYTGIFEVDPSSYSPLFQLQTAFILILAFFFLDERFTLEKYLWILLLLFGGILVSMNERLEVKSFLRKGVLFIVGMQFFHALTNMFTGIALRSITAFDVLFWQYVIIGLLAVPFYVYTRPQVKFPKKTVLNVLIVNIINIVGAVFLVTGFQSSVSLTSVIALMSAPVVFIISVVLSRFKPNFLEHHSPKVYAVRFIGIVLILIGVIQLSI